ncbi:unnamed protein product [Caenorhabditis nigoni]
MNASTSNWKIKDNDKKIDVLCGNSRYRFIKTSIPTAYYKYAKNHQLSGHWTERGKGMFIEYPNGGFTELFVYMLDTFRIKTVEEIKIKHFTQDVLSGSFGGYLGLVKFVIDRKMDVEVFNLGPLIVRDEREAINFIELSDQMNVTKAFNCDQLFPAGFQHHFTQFPKKINIWHSHWFQLDQLYTCSCTHIKLIESEFRNEDLDLLFQKWKTNEALPNLRLLGISTKNLDKQTPIFEMIPPINGTGNPRRRIYVENGDKKESLADPVRVKKDDGTVGWLRVELGNFSSVVELLVVHSSSTVREVEVW